MPDLRHAEPFWDGLSLEKQVLPYLMAELDKPLPADWEPSKVGGWFRLWRGGPGVSWTKAQPMFSERNGYRTPFLRLFGWRVFRLRSLKDA